MRRSNPRGKLFLIGGNEHAGSRSESRLQKNNPDFIPGELFIRFIHELKGTSHARIGVITTSSGHPDDTAKAFISIFHDMNSHRVDIFNIRSFDEANEENTLRMLDKMDGVFFSGGDQSRITRCLFGTQFNKMLCQKYMHENFIIAGTSSGAMALGELMISSGSAEEGFIKGEVAICKGLSIIKNVIIDTHFDARGRFHRLAGVCSVEKMLGVGLAEDTAVLIDGDQFRVFGSGVVTIIDTNDITDSNIQHVRDGSPICVKNLVVHILSARSMYRLYE